MLSFLPQVALLCGCALLYRRYWQPGNLLLAAVDGEGDEDIKIAGNHFTVSSTVEDAAELAAQDFLRQKHSGNIVKARELGSRYAKAVIDIEKGPLSGELVGRPDLMRHHQYLLYSYVVNRVIADHSPNSILAQTSLNIFYGQVEDASSELYKHVSDMAAFSLYILCERSNNRSDEEIGVIFAGLCGSDSDAELVRYGNQLYDKLYDYCIEEIRQIDYEDA